MSKETKFRRTYSLKLTIISILMYAIFFLGLGYAFNRVLNTPVSSDGTFQTTSAKVIVLLIILFFSAYLMSTLIGSISGTIKGSRIIAKENKYIKKVNPYIYYRELPNSFGIGVTSLLFDSKIENNKDIVAVILDLCARKYLSLIKQNDKYIIKVLKGIDDNLMSNEKYILNLILNNNIKGIDYQKWYNYCMQDGINLGLYYHVENKINNNLFIKEEEKIMIKRRKIKLILTIIFTVKAFLLISSSVDNLFISIMLTMFSFMVIYGFLSVPFYLLNLLTIIKNTAKESKNINYTIAMNNKLTRTKKGIDELQKLYSFEAFIKDFGNFVDKKPEEVVLWDRYLSYAQVFGLTKEIMDSGYNELINNSSFHIDSIDNINLYNIEVE